MGEGGGLLKLCNDSTTKLMATGYRYPECKCTLQILFSLSVPDNIGQDCWWLIFSGRNSPVILGSQNSFFYFIICAFYVISAVVLCRGRIKLLLLKKKLFLFQIWRRNCFFFKSPYSLHFCLNFLFQFSLKTGMSSAFLML